MLPRWRSSRVIVMPPMLFNVHVDDLENIMPNNLSIKTCKYADYCTQDEIVALGSTSHMQKVFETSQEWAIDNRIRINPDKTKDMWICFNSAIPTPALLTLDGAVIERVNSQKLLGVWPQENLKWNSHVEAVEESKQTFIVPERMPQSKLTIRSWPHMLSNKDKTDTGIRGTNLRRITGILDGGN